MALLFADSFDHYSTTELQALSKWDAQSTTSSNTINSTTGQNATNSWRVASNNVYLEKNLTDTQDLVFGFWFKYQTASTGSFQLMALLNLTTQQFGLVLENGRLTVTGISGARLGTTTAYLRPAVEYYIECKVHIENTIGVCEIRVNNNTVFYRTNISTGSALVNRFRLGTSTSSLGNADFDDLYILDTSGPAPNNDFLGPIHIEAIRPNAAGTNSEWSVLTGPSNYQDVDESPPDGDTSYVSTDVVNEMDTYNFPSLGMSAGSIKNVQINQYAKKQGVGTRTLNVAVQSTSTHISGTAQSVPGSAYKFMRYAIPLDPNTSSDWTITDFNAAEFGPHLVS